MNIPNFITLIRILLIPLIVILLMEDKADLAFLTFVIAGVSDALDGFIARLFKQKTKLGAFIDPIADKLLLDTSHISLAIFGYLPGWLAVLVVSRDVIILVGIGILYYNKKPPVIKPTFDSKVTTFMQLLTVCFMLGYQYWVDYLFLDDYLFFLNAFFTIVSCFHYIVIGTRILQGKFETRINSKIEQD